MVASKTFKALGDPIRLEILQRITKSTFNTVGSLSEGLSVTRQGARKHLQVLVEAELISLLPRGRVTEVILDTSSLDTAKSFITDLEHKWDQRLHALREFVENKSNI